MSNPTPQGRVLVLEDQGDFRDAVGKCFSREGYLSIQVADSQQFEERVGEEWDIAVLDLAVEPGESSRVQAVARGPLKMLNQAVLDTFCSRISAIREHSPLCYILVQTAHKPEDALGKALQEACNASFADDVVFLPLQGKNNLTSQVHETIKSFVRRACTNHQIRREAMKLALEHTGTKSLITEGLEDTLTKCLMKALHWPEMLPAGEKPPKVLLLGRTGSGKEFLARFIHELSPRRRGKFVTLDCPRITNEMSVSQYFGHRKNSFTGASDDREGIFHAILRDDPKFGTAFLDEVDSLPPQAQSMLLRFIDTRRLRRLGDESLQDSKLSLVDVCFIAASNCLPERVEQRKFRDDLMFRFQDVVWVPSLDERGEACIRAYVRDFAQRHNVEINDEVLDLLLKTSYDAQGGFRALEMVLNGALHSRVRPLSWLGIKNLDLNTFPWLGKQKSPVSSERIEGQRESKTASSCHPAPEAGAAVKTENADASYEAETARWYQNQTAQKANVDDGTALEVISTSTGDHRRIPVQNILRAIYENSEAEGEEVLKILGVQYGSRPWRNVLHEMRISLRDARGLAKKARRDQQPFRRFLREYADKHPECGLK